ncbi:metal ABC transporter ATP-binding protein [Leucobacter sp. NPDC015123]|uniref:metal ABC transporter ATP-binding protein n=1 Tax=Leucobacter sp. NPDC015123 TaxID=3364129 RepID=UPI0036F4AFC3
MTDLAPVRARALFYAHDSKPVLSGVSIDIPAGRVTALVGPNGAGKTTLVEVLAGVRRPTSGQVTRDTPIALVVQRPDAPSELPITGRQVVSLGVAAPARGIRPGRRSQAGQVAEALERVGASEFADAPFSQLSGGQRQRVLIAQGLAVGAGALLLDEPAAGLDEVSRERTREILAAEANRGVAVAVVTHDAADIAAADRVIRIESCRAHVDV